GARAVANSPSREIGRRDRRGFATPSARALAKENDSHGLEQDQEVEENRVVLDVVEVVLEFFHRLLDVGTVAVPHLCPTGDSRLDAVPDAVEGDLLAQHRHERWP